MKTIPELNIPEDRQKYLDRVYKKWIEEKVKKYIKEKQKSLKS